MSRHQKVRLDYKSLQWKSNALARGLSSIGVRKGGRVAVSLGNNIEFAIVWPDVQAYQDAADHTEGHL